MVLATAPDELERPPSVTGLLPAAEARRLVQGLKPKPWPVDRAGALAAVAGLELPGSAHAVWLSNGLDDGQFEALAQRLQKLGRLDVLRDASAGLSRLLLPPESEGLALTLRLRRALSLRSNVCLS